VLKAAGAAVLSIPSGRESGDATGAWIRDDLVQTA